MDFLETEKARFARPGERVTTVRKQSIRAEDSSINPYEALENWARAKVQDFIQDLLEEEVMEFVGHGKSERHHGSERQIYRNGYGRTRNFAMMGGTNSSMDRSQRKSQK